MAGVIGILGNMAPGIGHILVQAANETAAGGPSEAVAFGVLGGIMLITVLIMIFYLAMLALALIFFVIWVLMIVDCVRREDFKGENDKLLWILILILGGAIGAIIYYLVVMRKKG
jgi:TctA family transporter